MTRRARLPRRAALAIAIGLLLAAAAGGTGGWLLRGEHEDAPPDVTGGAALNSLPPAPVRVGAETVRLPEGGRERVSYGGPTFGIVRSGRLEVNEEPGRRVYDPGDLVVSEGDDPLTLHALSAVTMDVVRLLPPGAKAVTTLGPAP
jgi:hypothetical protein